MLALFQANRQFSSKQLLRPAAEACGLVIACTEAELQKTNCKEKRDELLDLLVEKVNELEHASLKKLDQVLICLDRLAVCSSSAALRLHGKVWRCIGTVHGEFLNYVQNVLIAAISHLSRSSSADNSDHQVLTLILSAALSFPRGCGGC